MNTYFWIVFLFIWVLGLAISFIIGMVSDAKSQDYSSKKEKEKKIRGMILSFSLSITSFVLVWLEQTFFNTNFIGIILFTSFLIFLMIQIIINTRKKK